MKNIIMTFLVLSLAVSVSAQDKKKQLVEITYETSIDCKHCVMNIMTNIPREKGVKNVKCDLETKEVKVTIRKDKSDAEKIKRAIEKLGYKAKKISEKPADKKKKSKE